MPKLRNRPPTYRLHRASGQACVELNGKTHYLGKHRTPASRQAYDRIIAEWLVSGRNLIADANLASAITVNQLFVAYWDFVQSYYHKDGVQTGKVQALRYSLQPVINLYGDTPVSQFAPLQLKADGVWTLLNVLIEEALWHEKFGCEKIGLHFINVRSRTRLGIPTPNFVAAPQLV